MEPEGLLPHSQVPCLYPVPAQFSPYPHTQFPKYPPLIRTRRIALLALNNFEVIGNNEWIADK
jgi:hypothetical protein